jgi:hypothetical protein
MDWGKLSIGRGAANASMLGIRKTGWLLRKIKNNDGLIFLKYQEQK